MLIETLSIENYRSIKKLTIKIKNNFLQLIGENNSGKTNVFRAIDLFFKSSVAGITQEDFFQKTIKNSIKISITFFNLTESENLFFQDSLCDNKLIITKIISINEETEKVSSDLLITREIPEIPHFDGSKFIKFGENSEAIIAYFKECDYEDGIKNDQGKITKASVEKAIPQFIKEKCNECEMKKKECTTKLKWKDFSSYLPEVLYIEATKKISEEVKTSEKSKSIYKKILEKIILRSIEDNSDDSKIIEEFKKKRNLLETFLKKGEDEEDKRFEIIKQIEKNLLKNLNQNITTNSIEIKIFPPRLQDFFTNTDIIINDGIESSIENKGDGLKRSLIFSLFITYSEYLKNKKKDKGISEYKPFLFLIEEPELYLHPQAQKSLRDTLILISNYDQVFYSTHSSNFIDISKYLSIGLTIKDPIETGTRISFIEKKLFEPHVQKDYELLMRFNPERNEMFFAKKVVLVEGNVEKIVLFHGAELMGKNFDKLNFSIIECGGKAMLSYFITVLSCYSKPIIVIHDIDPLTPEQEKSIDELRELGHDDRKIKQIQEKKRRFEDNNKINDLISKGHNKIGLITINPNFEKLIGITQHGDKKTLKAFKFAKNLSKENIGEDLSKIIDFILAFQIDETRQEIEKYEIDCISNNEESHLEEELLPTDETVHDKPNLDQKPKVKYKEQVNLDSFFES